jgi:hypothetical protein
MDLEIWFKCRVPTLQVQSLEFKHQTHQKKKGGGVDHKEEIVPDLSLKGLIIQYKR